MNTLGDRMLELLVRVMVTADVPTDASSVRVVFERPLPAWAWLLVAAGAVAIAVWSYRRLQGAAKPLSRTLRTVLVILRASVLLLLAFLISGPSVRFERARVKARMELAIQPKAEQMTKTKAAPKEK